MIGWNQTQLETAARGRFPLGTLFLKIFVAFAAALALAGGEEARAAGVEISLGGSFSRTQYTESDYSWTRRLGSSFGYHFNDRSEIELGVQDVTDRTHIAGYEDTTFHDRIYSLNWVQGILGKDYAIQPYFKFGIGQLNREASGSYANGVSPPLVVDSVTAVLGVGTRIYFTRNFALRGEVTSYLTGGSIRTWKDNIGATAGLSIYF